MSFVGQMMVVEGQELSSKIEKIISLDNLDRDDGTGEARGFVVVWEG